MFRYLIRRLLWAVLLFIAVTLVTYVIFYLAPGEPGAARVRRPAGDDSLPERRARAPQARRADHRPVRRTSSGASSATSRSAQSFVTRQDVNEIIAKAAPVTASLVFGGAVLWMHDRHLGRRLLGRTAPLALRSRRDGLRPHRRVSAPGLDRPDLLVLLRLQARVDRRSPATATSSTRQKGMRRARAVGLSHDPAVGARSRSSSPRSTCG